MELAVDRTSIRSDAAEEPTRRTVYYKLLDKLHELGYVANTSGE